LSSTVANTLERLLRELKGGDRQLAPSDAMRGPGFPHDSFIFKRAGELERPFREPTADCLNLAAADYPKRLFPTLPDRHPTLVEDWVAFV
jgi:hypothetical protein